jgi:hypothetical protein
MIQAFRFSLFAFRFSLSTFHFPLSTFRIGEGEGEGEGEGKPPVDLIATLHVEIADSLDSSGSHQTTAAIPQ